MIHDTYVIIYIYNIIQKPVGCWFMLFQHEFDSSEISEKKTRKYVGSPHFLIMLPTFLWRQWAWQKRPGPCGLCGQHVVKPSWKKLIGEWFVVWFGAIHWCWWKIMNDLWFGYKLYTTENNMNFWSSEPYTTGPIHGGCWDAKGPVLGLNAGRVWVSMRNKMGWDNCETRFLESDAWIIILNDILNYIVLYSYIYTHMYIIYIYIHSIFFIEHVEGTWPPTADGSVVLLVEPPRPEAFHHASQCLPAPCAKTVRVKPRHRRGWNAPWIIPDGSWRGWWDIVFYITIYHLLAYDG